MRDVLNPEKIKDASKEITGKALRVKEGRIAIKGSETTRSGGSSGLFDHADYAEFTDHPHLRHIELEEQLRKLKIASRDILDVALNVEEERILRR